MSNRYTGGIISATPPTISTSAASGTWTLEQQMQAQAAGTWPSPPVFIEDFFSTYLYTGNGTTQTITNNINLSGNGGMVWTKSRSNNTYEHELFDTVRGATKRIRSNSSNAEQTVNSLTAFGSSGYDISTDSGSVLGTNGSGATYVSWTFREQPKFFDIVTYTGNGSNPRQIAHNLGSAPGFIAAKKTSGAGDWFCYHRSLGATKFLSLNTIDQEYASSTFWGNTTPTSTEFTVSSNSNNSGDTYVAYLFAHDAGGFPVSGGGSTNGISCGSFTLDGSGNATVSLGYEPQWITIKKTSADENWYTNDTMRGLPIPASNQYLIPNTAAAEAGGAAIAPSSTGFNITGLSTSGSVYIYIAIRRGPMKTPTVGTSVFTPTVTTSTSAFSVGFPTDVWIGKETSRTNGAFVADRLRGRTKYLVTPTTAAEATDAGGIIVLTLQNSFSQGAASQRLINWNFGRAPGFMDEVCYTGTGSNTAFTHNLGVVPELMIVKARTNFYAATYWTVYHASLGATKCVNLNDTAAESTNSVFWNDTAPTSSVFTVGTFQDINSSGYTNVAYLFATCPGVSKVGSYTGTGALQTINCGFTAGSRFVMIKRTDSTGDWYVWDSARGITSGNDPYLLMNSTAIEVTSTNYVDTDTTGFKVTAAAPAALNASGGTFIFLAIA